MERNSIETFQALDREYAKVFTSIYDRYYLTIYYFANRYIDDESEVKDLISDTFLKLWGVRERISSIKNMEAYLKSMAYNGCMDYLKKKARQSKAYQELQNDGPEDAFELDEVRVEVMEYIAQRIERMPKKYQILYKLFYIDGLDIKDVAEKVHLSSSRVKGIKHAIIKELRYALNKKEFLTTVVILVLQGRA